jgi:hypothetical protein
MPAAFGWGCEGHQAIATMAENMLAGGVAQRVNQILASQPGPQLPRRYCDTGFSPMVEASTWADDFRELDRNTGPLHFIDIPIGSRQPPKVDAICEGNCVVSAIRSNLEKLKTSKDDAERATALRFIIHFVGDIHQPLHASTNNDHGGNCLPVTYYSDKATVSGPREDASPNLHSVWDSSILRTLMRRKDLTIESLAQRLQKQYADRLRRWASVQDPAAWALESFERSRTVTYGALPNRVPYETPAEVKTCADGNHIANRMLALDEHIDDVYMDSAFPVVQVQLGKAASRLARMLEEAFK